MTEEVKREIEKCWTGKQVFRVLAKHKIPVIRDSTEEMGAFSIWIDEFTRIYKPYRSRTMTVQKWKKAEYKYSGIPTFFGGGLFKNCIE